MLRRRIRSVKLIVLIVIISITYMRGLNPDQLRTLVEVIEQGGFSAAARRLHLSQPAVSLQVRELEERLGVRLIERIGKRAFPTGPGAELIEHARRIATANEAALDAMRRYREGWLGRVRLGVSAVELTYRLPPVLGALNREHPNIELVISTGSTTGVIERMLQNRVDLGVVTLPVDERTIKVTRLVDEELVALVPGREGAGEPISAAALARYPLIMEFSRTRTAKLVADWIADSGETLRPAMKIETVEGIKHCVSAGLGAAIVPALSVSRDPVANAVVRPLEPRMWRSVGLIERDDKPDEPALRYVRQALMTLKQA
jgi:DNA-binding transcriptional LysR family regulator